MRALAGAGAVAGLVLTGLAVGVASVLVHATAWGLPLVVAATGTTAYALRAGWTRRLVFVAAWAGAIGLLLVPRDEGDYLVAADPVGYVLLGWVLVLVVAGFATVPPARRGRALPPPDHPRS